MGLQWCSCVAFHRASLLFSGLGLLDRRSPRSCRKKKATRASSGLHWCGACTSSNRSRWARSRRDLFFSWQYRPYTICLRTLRREEGSTCQARTALEKCQTQDPNPAKALEQSSARRRSSSPKRGRNIHDARLTARPIFTSSCAV